MDAAKIDRIEENGKNIITHLAHLAKLSTEIFAICSESNNVKDGKKEVEDKESEISK